jgi:hypothetical protein
MSVNPQQAWATPETSLFGSGTGQNLTVQTITSAVTPSNVINMCDTNGNILTEVGLSSFVVSYQTPSDTRIILQPSANEKIGFFGTTTGGFWAVSNNGVAPNWGIQMNYMSSITGPLNQGTVDINGLISTLATVYPPLVK